MRRSVDPDGDDGAAGFSDTYFAQDGNHIVMQYDGYSEQDLTNIYLYGPAADEVLSDEQIHYDGGSSSYVTDDVLWALADNIGTVRDVIDNSGNVEIHREYNSFGKIVAETNPNAVDFLMAHTGRPLDKFTEDQNHSARWYDVDTGRWNSEDWIWGDSNSYRFVGNGPLDSVDPRVAPMILRRELCDLVRLVRKIVGVALAKRGSRNTQPRGTATALLCSSFGHGIIMSLENGRRKPLVAPPHRRVSEQVF